MASCSTMPPWAVRPLVPEPVYTDRAEHLEYLHHYALETIPRRAMSTVLLGQRRMGKTEIFKRVVNRLFFEQPEHADPQASVVPVYFCFEDKPMDRWEFAEVYTENFLRWYAAFRLRDVDILEHASMEKSDLSLLIRNRLEMSKGLQGALNLFDALPGRDLTDPAGRALRLPRQVSDRDESSIVMFLDEFQYTRLPQYNVDLVGMMQQAVESPTCPHFVTGSAMSILAAEILGRGSLFGRFRSEPIGPLTEYWGAELALKSAIHYRARLSEDMAPVLASRCGGNPFYITAVVRQSVRQDKVLDSEERINEILAVDLSSGFIWGELNDQVTRWIERINEHGITKWILYLSALEEGERIDLERIQRRLWEKDRKRVSVETIRDVLIQLSRGDLVEFLELGNWFRKVDDPILLEFLKVWGRITVEGRRASAVHDELRTLYGKMQRRIADHLGYLGEVYMAQVLWNSQDKTLPGRYFHSDGDIPVNWRFSYIHHRVRLGAAADMEVDVYGAAGGEVWLCESKWRRNRKAGVKDVRSLLAKGRRVTEDKGDDLQLLRLWFFSHGGFTAEAQTLMADQGVLWCDRDDLNALLAHVGLKRLPQIHGEDVPEEGG